MPAWGAGSVTAPVLPPQVIYPERPGKRETWIDRWVAAGQAMVLSPMPALRGARLKGIARRVAAHEKAVASLDEDGLRLYAGEVARDLRRAAAFDEPIVARAFALIREVSDRVLGMRHYDVQLAGGLALLRGMIAEMETGEGKTLVATLAAGTAGLAGIPVHVVTVNDYLARRDAEIMGPLYAFFGLSVGIVVHGQTPDERRQAYACDITYCTNKELAFDHLRDRGVLRGSRGNLRLKLERLCDEGTSDERLLLRGLHFAIVDEADSVLIDEARTPLVISGHADSEADGRTYETALETARTLKRGDHFTIHQSERRIILTPAGQRHLGSMAETHGGQWRVKIVREELITQALTALLLFDRDDHYLVRDGKVVIIDEYTGRVMADRFWSEGLHQMIELKEGCEPSARRTTVSRMTYQRFFRRYRRLAGMTGTAHGLGRELWTVYRLPVARIPTNKPAQRVHLRDRIVAENDRKWRLIAERIAELNAKGCPVLLGTRSVAASIEASDALTAAGLQHVVLNAAQDRQEAEIVAQAGLRGQITVATNMAGRGTDIKLAPGVDQLGGLHVIMSERHDARRIDRQLAGRCGRQGEPGCVQAIVSLDDPILGKDAAGVVRLVAKAAMPFLGSWVGLAALGVAQLGAEMLHSRMRRQLLASDRAIGDMLAFSGEIE